MSILQLATLVFAMGFFGGLIYIAYQIKPTKEEEESAFVKH